MSQSLLVLVAAGLAVAVGLVMILRAVSDVAAEPGDGFGPTRAEVWQSYLQDRALWRRIGITAAVAVLAGLFTGWPAAALMAGGGVWFLPSLLGRDTTSKAEITRIEAIATWTEMMRDTLSAAAGLEQAVLATAQAAPEPIRPEVAAMAAAIGRGARLEDALKGLAQDLMDPTADLIVAALILSSRQQARNLADVLGSLADATRAQAGLRMRTAADRARTRTSVRMIVSTVLAIAVALILFNRTYLNPYDTATGQLVLVVIASMFGMSTMWLSKIAKGKTPTRFLTRMDPEAEHVDRRSLS
ncbi:MAG TPA: type II secretion system F family protein [Actinocrinis sp.]|nr:type II secretion system F family protein [Actinocrinis sp.]